MMRSTIATSLLVILGATVLASSSDDKTPTIKEVMKKLHGKGANSGIAKLKKGLAARSPDWKAVQKTTKSFATLGAALPKNEAPKGDQDAYKKLADAYAANAKALDDGAEQEDLDAAKAAFGKIGASCKACHSAHRP
jgi:cytochrome c556